MKLWLSPYELISQNKEVRRGYLLKTQSEGQEAGYADIFPWPEFGDPEFADIPFLLKMGKASPLVRRSLYFSRKDALERTEGVATPRKSLCNHHLLGSDPGQWVAQSERALALGFTKIKIKVGRRWAEEINPLLEVATLQDVSAWLRLDFNTKATKECLSALAPIEAKVEYIEDPFKDLKDWQQIRGKWAYDQAPLDAAVLPYNVRIVKPAKQETPQNEKQPIVYTSYLDHPVGIAHAFCEAIEFGDQSIDYGLSSQDFYQSTEFHDYLLMDQNRLSLAPGQGIGFDDLFEKQQWVEI